MPHNNFSSWPSDQQRRLSLATGDLCSPSASRVPCQPLSSFLPGRHTASREGRHIDLLCCFCSHPKEKNFTHFVLAVSTPPPGAEWCSLFPCINFKHSVIIRPALPYMPGLYVPPAQPLPLSVPAVLVLMSRMPVSHYSSCAQEVFLQLACQNIPFSPFQSVLPALQNPAN